MSIARRTWWRVREHQITPPTVFHNRARHRREFLATLGVGMAGASLLPGLAGCGTPTDEALKAGGAPPAYPEAIASRYPADRTESFEYGRPETPQRAAAEYTNFYEFSSSKDGWRRVGRFQPLPWAIEVGGECARPSTFDLDDIHKRFKLEERAYRHRCVETWAMCVPWTGFPLRELLKAVEPKPSAAYVAFESFNRPKEAAGIRNSPGFPWPYTEGLTIDEALNDLTLLATGIYGEPLPKQHGAPVRLVVPWKYGFKSIKSVARITLTSRPPATFWNTLSPDEYAFEANVDPDVPHPRWSQRTEWMLGTRERYETVVYNGYGDFVGGLYAES